MPRSRGPTLAWLLPAAVLAVTAVAVGVTLTRTRPGVHVTVVNHGPQLLPTVVLAVTGRVHSLGDLGPGEATTRKVLPTGESDLQIEYTDDQGRRRRLKVDCYIESGYRGAMRVEFRDGRIVHVVNEVRVGAS
jgi:hypothetical protein